MAPLSPKRVVIASTANDNAAPMSVASTRPQAVAPARWVMLGCLLAVTAFTSRSEHWQPGSLVVVLTAATVIGDLAAVKVRGVRISEGGTIQVSMMALLGPGPAVVAGVVANVVDARVNRITAPGAMGNVTLYALFGLVGGLLFELLRDLTGLDRDDALYAAFVLPVYVLMARASLLIVVTRPTGGPRRSMRSVLRQTGVPVIALDLVNGLLAAVVVLAWAEGGLTAVAFAAVVLAIGIPVTWTVAHTLRSDDEVVAMRQVSDERAAQVARLASDRERLLSEVLHAEERERARLAESLHDGPMQRLVALRQDVAEADAPTAQLDAAIAETRAIISAFHPVTARELGFAGSLHAAVAPFPAAKDIALTVHATADDGALAGSLLLPLARELVVNAVKHADPSRIDVQVEQVDGRLVLEVNDDGVGIDGTRAFSAVRAGHVGLATVRRRVEDAGGAIEIATRPDGGTRSRVVLPSHGAAG
jgi:signal transduction histidine kinase